MKYLLILVLIVKITTFQSFAQINPTLSAGLDELTMKRGTIDVAALTAVIMEKQKELKSEALKRFIIKLFPEDNITTKFYVQNCLTILLNEKNPQVIEKELTELTTNYALSIGIAKAYASVKKHQLYLDSIYRTTYIKTHLYSHQLLANYDTLVENDKLLKLQGQRDNLTKLITETTNAIRNNPTKPDLIHKLQEQTEELTKTHKRISQFNLRKDFSIQSYDSQSTSIPFNILLDVTSSVLSKMPVLQKKGFFKHRIDYKQAPFYKDLQLTGNKDAELMRQQVELLADRVKKYIEPYIENYEVIKEFIASEAIKGDSTKVKDIIFSYVEQANAAAGGKVNLEKLIKSVIDQNTNSHQFVDSSEFKRYFSNISKWSNRRDDFKTYQISLNRLNELTNKKIDTTGLRAQYDSMRARYAFLPSKIEIIDPSGFPSLSKLDSTAIVLLQSNFKNAVAVNKQLQTDFEKKLVSLDSEIKLYLKAAGVKEQPAVNPNTTDLLSYLSSQMTLIENRLVSTYDSIATTEQFYKLYSDALLNSLIDIKDLVPGNNPQLTSQQLEAYTQLLSKTYVKINELSKQKKISIKDIQYLEKEVVPGLMSYGYLTASQANNISQMIRKMQVFSNLLKIKAVSKVETLSNLSPTLLEMFSFISNLDNLNRAETYQGMLNMFRLANEDVERSLPNGQFKDVYLLFVNAVEKYTLISSEKQSIELDIPSFLRDMEQFYVQHNRSNFGFYLTLGLNQNTFLKSSTLPGSTDTVKNVGFASEKIGIRYRIWNIKKTLGYQNALADDIYLNKKAPFVNDLYVAVYGSGLLYSIANTATEKNFNFPHIGIAGGFRFYNALDVNLTFGLPFVKNSSPWKHSFVGLGLDIPLGEYLEKIGRK